MTSTVVVLDRIVTGWVPPYCTHGRATCVGDCGEWVWLGHATWEAVVQREVLPLCQPCALRLIPPADRKVVGRLDDHLRADGPHE
jgi:hypothetical protein